MSATPMPVEVPAGGAGDDLPSWLLDICGLCTLVATGLSIASIVLQLKNYRMPELQRNVVRIMVMVPLYACSSLIALYSLNAAFFIDAIRDLYEAFVIYAFLQLLITYLGGERELLLRLRGRPPIPHPFPMNLFLRPMDPSDPWTLLNLKRGVLQYVQVKPLLVLLVAFCKATGTYHEGTFSWTSGYTWVTIIYNVSICLSLYCLAMFWVAVSKDLKPFRPVPKFLCVKGILFFSFWQSVLIGFLVSVRAIKHVGVYTDPEHMTMAIVDSLICIEMPFFAIAHQYAFKASDYIDTRLNHVARLPFIFAFRDAFGVKDVWADIKYTFRARGISYKAYEAADGRLHNEEGRTKRIRAGLRYSKGGKTKYWIDVPGQEDQRIQVDSRTPLLPNHRVGYSASGVGSDSDSDVSDAPSLEFSSASDSEDGLYQRARRIGYTGFPNVDVSEENLRRRRRFEEGEILAGRRTRSGGVVTARDLNTGTFSPPLPPMPWRRSSKGKAKDTEPPKKLYGAWADRHSVGRDLNKLGLDTGPEEPELAQPTPRKARRSSKSSRSSPSVKPRRSSRASKTAAPSRAPYEADSEDAAAWSSTQEEVVPSRWTQPRQRQSNDFTDYFSHPALASPRPGSPFDAVGSPDQDAWDELRDRRSPVMRRDDAVDLIPAQDAWGDERDEWGGR